MTDSEKKAFLALDLEETVDILIEEHCFSPIVDAIVANLQLKLSKLEHIIKIIEEK